MNLGSSLETKATSTSVGLKSADKMVDKQLIANWTVSSSVYSDFFLNFFSYKRHKNLLRLLSLSKPNFIIGMTLSLAY